MMMSRRKGSISRRAGSTLALAMLMTLISACTTITTYNYSKPGFDQTQFNSDIGSCRLMARAGSQTSGYRAYGTYSSTTAPTEPDPGIANDCMRSKGYTVKKCASEDISTCTVDY